MQSQEVFTDFRRDVISNELWPPEKRGPLAREDALFVLKEKIKVVREFTGVDDVLAGQGFQRTYGAERYIKPGFVLATSVLTDTYFPLLSHRPESDSDAGYIINKERVGRHMMFASIVEGEFNENEEPKEGHTSMHGHLEGRWEHYFLLGGKATINDIPLIDYMRVPPFATHVVRTPKGSGAFLVLLLENSAFVPDSLLHIKKWPIEEQKPRRIEI